jgi:hypothetical protein
MFVLDLFPSDILVTPLEVIPEVEHQRFPRIAVYDTTQIPRSPWNGIDVPSMTILTYPVPIHSDDNCQIPDNAPYHFKRIYSQPHQLVLPFDIPSKQFSLQLTGETESSSEPSIVVRRGFQVLVLERVWVLTMVTCGNRRLHLRYECWNDPVPAMIMITQDIPRRPEIVGEYHWMRV